MQTNPSEASEFVSTYMMNKPFLNFLIGVLLIAAIQVVVLSKKKLGHWICSMMYKYALVMLLFVWALPMTIRMLSTDVGGFGLDPMFNPYNNFLWHDIVTGRGRKIAKGTFSHFDYEKMLAVSDTVSCSYTSGNIVIVLGESYNRHHSSQYGYSLPTSDVLDSLHPIVFSNVIAECNVTHKALKSLLSLYTYDSNTPWNKTPLLFPLLRRAGYGVTFYSNQFAGKSDTKNGLWDQLGGMLLDDMKIADSSYTYRNKMRYLYDEELVSNFLSERESIEKTHKYNFTIVHMYGQHSNSQDRYPKSKARFSVANYSTRPELSEELAQQVANYDNAIYYGDCQLARIVEAYKDEDAIIIFLSDHGDEANDYRPHIGRAHGSETMPPAGLHCQFDIPFYVFTTDSYKENHPDILTQLDRAKDKPFMTDAFPHMILYLAGIHTSWYKNELNPLEENYDESRKRVLSDSSIDYDSVCSKDDKVIGF
mgnify:FL=1